MDKRMNKDDENPRPLKMFKAESDSDEDSTDLPEVSKMRLQSRDKAEEDVANECEDYSNELSERRDHAIRPIWVLPNGIIYAEAFNPAFEDLQDFIIAISEPVSRPMFIHEYNLTAYSLYAAVSSGLQTDKIIQKIDAYCKYDVPEKVVSFIQNCTEKCGKIKLVLRNNHYFIESFFPEVLKDLINDPGVLQTIVYNAAAGWKDTDGGKECMSFEVARGQLENLQKRCKQLSYLLLQEYDFKNDTVNPNANITLKPEANLRPYQKKGLDKMFNNDLARSGVIVLPCGAGKTLTGVAAACRVGKNCLVLCTSSIAVDQWKNQFKMWSTASDKSICRFTSDAKDPWKNCKIFISTYSMITHSAKRSYEAEKVMDWVGSTEWGLMILDEVQFVPARMFRKVISAVNSHCKLGLTATLVREDDKISDLNFLIGPKLYEADWMELQRKGYIATVHCKEVRCQMTSEFHYEYFKMSHAKKTLLYVMNPNKFRTCQHLIQYHEKKKDKIIVFVDNLYALRVYALKLRKPYLFGETPLEERKLILENFKRNPKINTVFVSKIADNSFDLPEANVLIQVSSQGGSRRQEAQRLGRILRAKKESANEAHFYSLVSMDTCEVAYAEKRQSFLVNQGYSYEIVTNFPGMDTDDGLAFGTKEEQRVLLTELLKVADSELGDEEDDPDNNFNKKKPKNPEPKRTQHKLFKKFR